MLRFLLPSDHCMVWKASETLQLSLCIIACFTFTYLNHKKFMKLVFYFSIMYSAKIPGELYFFPSSPFSLWACGAVCQICGMPVGCSQERHGALIQHKQGHKTTTQPLAQSLLQISPTLVQVHRSHSSWCHVRGGELTMWDWNKGRNWIRLHHRKGKFFFPYLFNEILERSQQWHKGLNSPPKNRLIFLLLIF